MLRDDFLRKLDAVRAAVAALPEDMDFISASADGIYPHINFMDRIQISGKSRSALKLNDGPVAIKEVEGRIHCTAQIGGVTLVYVEAAQP